MSVQKPVVSTYWRYDKEISEYRRNVCVLRGNRGSQDPTFGKISGWDELVGFPGVYVRGKNRDPLFWRNTTLKSGNLLHPFLERVGCSDDDTPVGGGHDHDFRAPDSIPHTPEVHNTSPRASRGKPPTLPTPGPSFAVTCAPRVSVWRDYEGERGQERRSTERFRVGVES